MQPIDFSQDTIVLKGFGDVADMKVLPVNYADGQGAMVSCWRLTWREALKALFARRVYLAVMGTRHPPVAMAVHAKEVGA